MIATFVLALAAATPGATVGVAPYVTCAAPHEIHVVAANASPREVRLSMSSLPWHSSSNVIRLRAFSTTPEGTVKELIRTDPIADYWGYTKIGPNSDLSGSFTVETRFGGFDKAVREGTVTLVYEVVDGRGRYSGGSGLIIFPRSRWFSRACPYIIRSAPGFLEVSLPSSREKATTPGSKRVQGGAPHRFMSAPGR